MATIGQNTGSGKLDNNTPASSSDSDGFPGSLSEREARSYRPDGTFHRGTAVAVVAGDGSAIGSSLETIMADLLYEIRALRMGMIIQGTAADLDDGLDRLIRV